MTSKFFGDEIVKIRDQISDIARKACHDTRNALQAANHVLEVARSIEDAAAIRERDRSLAEGIEKLTKSRECAKCGGSGSEYRPGIGDYMDCGACGGRGY